MMWFIGILIAAGAMRLGLALAAVGLPADGCAYLGLARSATAGGWAAAVDPVLPPVYPVLVAVASRVIPDLELAGRLISVGFGTLMLVPLFALARAWTSHRAAWLTLVLAAAHPQLLRYSADVLTEATYTAFLVSAVWATWRASERPRLGWAVALGGLTALAFLTRSEGIALVGLAGGFAAWRQRQQGVAWGRVVGLALATGIVFLALAGPYLLAIRRATGAWQISGKQHGVLATIITLSEANQPEATREPGVPLDQPLVGTDTNLGRFLLHHPGKFLRKLSWDLPTAVLQLVAAAHPALALWAVGRWWGRRTTWGVGDRLALVILGAYLLALAVIVPNRRYFVPLVPLVLPWAAVGMVRGADWVAHRRRLMARTAVVACVLVTVVITAPQSLKGLRTHRAGQREAGVWLKTHGTPGSRLLSREPQEAFYAGMEFVLLPDGTYDQLLAYARAREARYLLTDKNINRYSAGFREAVRPGDLRVVYRGDVARRRDIVIYEVMAGPEAP